MGFSDTRFVWWLPFHFSIVSSIKKIDNKTLHLTQLFIVISTFLVFFYVRTIWNRQVILPNKSNSIFQFPKNIFLMKVIKSKLELRNISCNCVLFTFTFQRTFRKLIKNIILSTMSSSLILYLGVSQPFFFGESTRSGGNPIKEIQP